MSSTDEHTVIEMLSRYGFDLGGQTAVNLVRAWKKSYEPTWLLPATIEALDRGRYKAASIEQVLTGWQRLGEANPRFSAEFAGMILSKMEVNPELLDDSDLNESLLDAEIVSCAESVNDQPIVDLSIPALDEEPNEVERLLSTPIPQATSLIASYYPPVPLRKPDDTWAEIEEAPPLSDTFVPSSQVSQFYYRLLAMADTAPVHSAEATVVAQQPSLESIGFKQAAEG
jgi:hypothetical protein